MDIDRFKGVNDAYGHTVGDQVTQAVAARCRANARDLDLLGRYGGDEFVVLLLQSPLADARNVAERFRRCIAEAPIDTERGPLTITISVGVSTLTEDCPSLTALLNDADAGLYAAKKAGRNRVGAMS